MTAGSDLHIGKIVGVHGIKGYLKVLSYSESAEPFEPGRQLFVRQGGNGPEAYTEAYTVRDARQHKRLLRVAFEAVETREAAEALVGAELTIDRSELPELEAGTWYWSDLIGLAVYEGDAYIGEVAHIFATGSNDVLVVTCGENERLIPAVDSIVRRIDLDEKTMQVELPEGL